MSHLGFLFANKTETLPIWMSCSVAESFRLYRWPKSTRMRFKWEIC